MCEVIPLQNKTRNFSLLNFRKFFVQFSCFPKSFWVKALSLGINHFPSLSIIWNFLQGANPLSHHPNHWGRHLKNLDVLNAPFVTGLQLDVKPLIMTHFSLASQPFFKHTHASFNTFSTWKQECCGWEFQKCYLRQDIFFTVSLFT